MGGGDLNSKKSWHPNTMKNQERVWKAEQAAAEEKKRIQELQHERAAERDRAELNDLAKRSAGAANNDDRLHWMYDKPDRKGQSEDYLLGKTIEKNYDQPEKSDDVIPAVARRVVGSSMMTSTEDSQVDLARKLREDPLLLVKERERAARAALLNNPLHRKRITELLRKEQELQKESKVKKSKKKDKDLDSMLAAKLNSLGGDKGIDVAALLASDDSSSSSESSDDGNKRKKKKNKKDEKKTKKIKKSKKTKKEDKTESSDEDYVQQKLKYKNKSSNKQLQGSSRNNSLHEINSRKERKRYHSASSDVESNTGTNSKSRRYKEDLKANKLDTRHKGDHRDSSRRRSESQDFQKEVKDRKKRDVSEDRNYKSYWAQSRRHSLSSESNQETKNSYKSEHRRHRSGSHESDKDFKSKRRDVAEDRKYKYDNKNKDTEAKIKAKKRENEDDSRNKQSSRDKRESGRKTSERKGRAEETQGRMKKGGLSADERAARLAEMAAAGLEREEERGRRVAAQRARGEGEDAAPRPRARPHALPDSLEARIHSNRHYIQRNQSHMNEHFARR